MTTIAAKNYGHKIVMGADSQVTSNEHYTQIQMEHRFWRYKCKSCGAQIDRNINPNIEHKNNFAITNGSVTIEN